MKKSGASHGQSASELISKRIAELGDWRGETLGRMRGLIKQADPEVVEEWKWMGTPVWSHDGIICTGESYKNVVKLTFAKGASLKDPARLFNSSLDGNVRRAIDIHQGEEVDAVRLQGARSPGGRPQQFRQVETFEESQALSVLRDSAPEPVRDRGGTMTSIRGTRVKQKRSYPVTCGTAQKRFETQQKHGFLRARSDIGAASERRRATSEQHRGNIGTASKQHYRANHCAFRRRSEGRRSS